MGYQSIELESLILIEVLLSCGLVVFCVKQRHKSSVTGSNIPVVHTYTTLGPASMSHTSLDQGMDPPQAEYHFPLKFLKRYPNVPDILKP